MTISVNILRPRQNCHFPDDIFKCIFLNENVWISLKISLKFVPKVQINTIPALVNIMVWSRVIIWTNAGNLMTHIRVTRPQWLKKKRVLSDDMPFEGLLHDAVLIWAYGVNRTLREGGVPDHGINITKNIFNMVIDGVSGSGQVKYFVNCVDIVCYYQLIYIHNSS